MWRGRKGNSGQTTPIATANTPTSSNAPKCLLGLQPLRPFSFPATERQLLSAGAVAVVPTGGPPRDPSARSLPPPLPPRLKRVASHVFEAWASRWFRNEGQRVGERAPRAWGGAAKHTRLHIRVGVGEAADENRANAVADALALSATGGAAPPMHHAQRHTTRHT